MMNSIDARPSWVSVTFAYLRLPHALPILVVMVTTAVLTVIVERHVAWSTLTAILLAMLGAQIVIGVVNELVDLDLDRASRPDKPLVSGLVSHRGAVTLLVYGLVLMVAAGAKLGAAPLVICLTGCALGVAYSLWFKRTVLAWLPYLAAIPLLPIWVAVSLGKFSNEWLLAYPLGCCALAGVQVAQAVPDIASDRSSDIASLTTVLGERRSLYLCWVATTGSALLVGLTSSDPKIGIGVPALVVLGVLVNAGLYRIRPRLGVRSAFPIVAAGTALLGIAWVYAIN
jgi:4-hydroxybenzoate polyprenyltransferase